ncbi:uncharacterized protein [Typha latifolia]|uniref:uncharacterized protein n=1 Tax=Typha latifolia TaxID=4733 RepID=UPI003C2D7644
MKKFAHPGEDEPDLELLKAVAQAWHAQSCSNTKPAKEFDAQKGSVDRRRPSRFKLEAIGMASKAGEAANWDFAQSLWDSYEIVTLSKKLEANLALDQYPMSGHADSAGRAGKRVRESKHSLRRLLHRAGKGFGGHDGGGREEM